MKINVLLVDDHRLVREALGALLSQEPDIAVVGQAADGTEAVHLAGALQPDVVLLDVCMPVMNGIEAAEALVRMGFRGRIISLSAQSERAFVAPMLQAGACGFVRKDQSPQELAAAIRAAMQGLNTTVTSVAEHDYPALPALSRRERAVLAALARHRRSSEVAAELGIGTKTVDTYRRRLAFKLGLSSQVELLRYAALLAAGGGAATGARDLDLTDKF